MKASRPRAARALGAMLAIAAGSGCKIPSTLGLPCHEDSHCDAGQHCGDDDTCHEGPAPGDTTDATTAPGTTIASTSTSTSTSTGPTTMLTDQSASSAPSESSSTTGPACGEAIGTCDAIDVLFVVDSSDSMTEDFSTLLPAFTDFDAVAQTFIEGFCSYHIGVTTTEVAPDFQPEECQVRGALSRSGALTGPSGCWPEDPDHPPFITEADPLASLGCLLAVGQANDDDEKQLETAIAAVGPDLAAPGACNEGFLRDGVPLVVVIVSDEDDDDDSMTPGEDETRTGSAGDPTAWFDALTAIRPARELGVIFVGAIENGGCGWEPLPGNDDGTGAEYATRILTFLQHFNGSGYGDHIESANICGSAIDLMMDLEAFHSVIAAVCEDSM